MKTIGDEVFSYFDATTSPENIIKCAIDIIQSFDNLKSFQQGKSKIEVKISLDFGQTYNGTILDSTPYDPIGGSVDRCARLNKAANSSEIIFSDDFLSLVKNQNRLSELKTKYAYQEYEKGFEGVWKN